MEKQHLIWKSVELEDKLKVSDYNLTTGSTLQLVTAMRGGPLNIRRGNQCHSLVVENVRYVRTSYAKRRCVYICLSIAMRKETE